MTAVLLIAHAPLASALRDAALHVLPDAAPDVLALDVYADTPPERTRDVARTLVDERGGAGVLVLCDLVGATPCNVATELLVHEDVRLLAGANLPMLLRALNYRHEPLARVAQRALTGGTRGVVAVDAEPVRADSTATCAMHDS